MHLTGLPVQPPPDDPSEPTGTGACVPAASALHQVGDYRLLRCLAEGGMSSVYFAYKAGADQTAALKVLADHLAKDPNYVNRFRREAKLSLALKHANLVRGLATGVDADTGKHFLALEYIDGPTAQQLLARSGPLSVGDAVCVALDIARALEYMHGLNLIHRDIKPDNILITPGGVAKLADLGLTKYLEDDMSLTTFDQGFGTTYYMPYEQALNARFVDGRSDIFALGATLYHLLAGEVPFPGGTHQEVTRAKEVGTYRPASVVNPRVPTVMDAVLAQMLARDPRERFQTVSELVIALERTRLAAGWPSFGRLDEALRDPLVRERLTSTTEPTRPDLRALAPAPKATADSSGSHTPLPPDACLWQLELGLRNGKIRKMQATTEQILQWGAEGRLPREARAARRAGRAFRPLTAYPEFSSLPPPPAAPVPRKTRSDPGASRWDRWHILLGISLAVGLLAGLAAVAVLRWFLPT